MQFPARLPFRASSSMLGILTLSLSACVLGPKADPGLERVIKAHYAGHATEEDGVCRTPRIDTVQSYQMTGQSERGSEVMAVRYSYYDPHADMDADWSTFVHIGQKCGGLAERHFSLTRTDHGYQVTEMSGEQREGGRTN